MKLTIITPCSRPENLCKMLPGIETGGLYFDIDWRVVFDTSVCQPVDVPGAKLDAVSDPGSRFGNAQRNKALDSFVDGWVYFLDDDTIMHPDFWDGLDAAIEAMPKAQAFAFHQDLGGGRRRMASADTIRVNEIDMGQVCIRRELIGSQRFELYPYNSDGLFIEAIFQRAPEKWAIINEVMSIYNGLRQS